MFDMIKYLCWGCAVDFFEFIWGHTYNLFPGNPDYNEGDIERQ